MTEAVCVLRPRSMIARPRCAGRRVAALRRAARAGRRRAGAAVDHGARRLQGPSANCTPIPFGLPRVWVWSNYWDILSGYRYWQVLGNSLLIALATVFLTLRSRRWPPSPSRISGSSATASCSPICSWGCCFPPPTADAAAVHQDPRPRPAQFLLGRHPAASRVLARRWRVLLLRNAFKQLPAELFDAALMDGCGYFGYLLLHHLAAVGADPVDRRRHRLRRQLEQLSAAARRAQQRIALPLDAGPDGLSGPVSRPRGSSCSPSSR